jgi:hypothetical protein
VKKTGAVILFVLLLANTAGLYLFFSILLWHENQELETRMDKNEVNTEALLLFKSSINLPYEPNWGSYQRMDGEIIYHGQYYNAYQHRILRDTMYTLYVKDVVKNQLYQKLNTIIYLFSSIRPDNNHAARNYNVDFLKEYLPAKPSQLCAGAVYAACVFAPSKEDNIYNTNREVITPPPEIPT